MTIKDLKNIIANLPDEAIVYVEADHGQLPEHAGFVDITYDSQLHFYGDEIDWRTTEDMLYNQVTAICIG
jgi:hypothetical protein